MIDVYLPWVLIQNKPRFIHEKFTREKEKETAKKILLYYYGKKNESSLNRAYTIEHGDYENTQIQTNVFGSHSGDGITIII